VPHRDLIEVVLEALPDEFNFIVAQLITQEERNEKFKKALGGDFVFVN